MDSKINGIQTHIAKEPASTSRWSAHHRLYDRYFFKSNGMDGEQEMVSVRDETCHTAPDAVEIAAVREERQSFNNLPLKGLENLKLF
jgi:3'-5' exoribonuclease